ncbi:hypothetical protein RUR49_05630 [Pseudoxanthobacter sp. M-2]|uniref:hypothetical protein n=1 Tax=Pseudoxanthobacter sp. M-2 TaxID=3078754 RepID=UPI0038FBF750
MALMEAKSLVRLSRMRVLYGIDPETNEHCYEVGLFGEDGTKGLKKLIIDLPNMHVLAAELEACAAVLKAHIVFSEQAGHATDAPE